MKMNTHTLLYNNLYFDDKDQVIKNDVVFFHVAISFPVPPPVFPELYTPGLNSKTPIILE